MTIIDCISDLHGHYPKLQGGDLLIVAGDITGEDTEEGFLEFAHWIQDQKYRNVVFIAGNHDNWVQKNVSKWCVISEEMQMNIHYLCDTGIELMIFDSIGPPCEGKEVNPKELKRRRFKIWGSPWTPSFPNVNPKCKAFMKKDSSLNKYWDMIPSDIDILITHTPPKNFLDVNIGNRNSHCGSQTLLDRIVKVKPKFHIFGHIHEDYGHRTVPRHLDHKVISFINCSHVDHTYKQINPPIRIEIDTEDKCTIKCLGRNKHKGSSWKYGD